MKGRKRKPTALRVLEGNPGKRPINKSEPKPRPILPKCPAWFDELAKAEWKRLAAILEPLAMATEADWEMVGAICLAWSELQRATVILNEHGLTYEGKEGPKPRPEVAIARNARAQIKMLGSEFGMSPSSRSRLSFNPKEPEEGMAALLG